MGSGKDELIIVLVKIEINLFISCKLSLSALLPKAHPLLGPGSFKSDRSLL